MFLSDRELLRHIKIELDFLVLESRKTDIDNFLTNGVLQRAFARSLEIIGEAVKKLSKPCEFKYLSFFQDKGN